MKGEQNVNVTIYYMFDRSIWKVVCLGRKSCLGNFKFVVTVVLMPLILICMVIGGLLNLALPILIIVGFVVMFKSE